MRAAEWYTRAGKRAINLGGLSEARELFTQALSLLPASGYEQRWHALLGRSEALLQMGEKTARQDDDQAMKEIADQLGDLTLQAETYSHIAYHAYILGDYSRAAENYTSAIEFAHRAGDIAKEAVNLSLQVANLTRQGNLDAAALLVDSAFELAKQAGDPNLMMHTLTNLSTYFTMAGDLARASDLILQQIQINQNQGNLVGEMYSLTNLGFNYLLLGRYRGGLQMLQRALEITKTTGARQVGAYTKLNLAMAHWRLGDFPAAQRFLEGLFEQLGAMGDEMAQGSERYYEGLVLESTGEWEAAEDCYQQARDIFAKLGIEPQRIELQSCLAHLYQQMGEKDASLRLASETAGYLLDKGCSGIELPFITFLSCAEAFQAAGDLARMARVVQSGIDELRRRADRISDPYWRQVFLDVPPEHQKLAEFYSRRTIEN